MLAYVVVKLVLVVVVVVKVVVVILLYELFRFSGGYWYLVHEQ